ncbi:Repetin, partial [Camelus dromedarius]
MAQLLNSILTVIKVFEKYAKENGDRNSLCKKELKQLLLAEFGDILRRPNDPETVETILSLLDKDRNG